MAERFLLACGRWLDELLIRYAVVGGVAVVRYGFTRNTKDLDLLIEPSSLPRMQNRLREEGFEPGLTDERSFHVFENPGSRKKVDLLLALNAFERGVIERSTPVQIEDRQIFFCRLEDLVALKLKAAQDDPERREGIDLVDVKNLLALARDEDRGRIEGVIRVFGREDLL